jgi:hypothetical protein
MRQVTKTIEMIHETNVSTSSNPLPSWLIFGLNTIYWLKISFLETNHFEEECKMLWTFVVFQQWNDFQVVILFFSQSCPIHFLSDVTLHDQEWKQIILWKCITWKYSLKLPNRNNSFEKDTNSTISISFEQTNAMFNFDVKCQNYKNKDNFLRCFKSRLDNEGSSEKWSDSWVW